MARTAPQQRGARAPGRSSIDRAPQPLSAICKTQDERRQVISNVCLGLQAKLGLQSDSVRNQAEHIDALWESFLRRHSDGPVAALQDLRNQLLRTQKQWWTKVWQPFMGAPLLDDADPLLDVCLFLLLWGELGNLRFCPELGCFLFAAARSYCKSPASEGIQSEGTFLNEIVKPIFNVILRETYEVQAGKAPKFKFGKAPAPAQACNYDDWNEIFWDRSRLQKALKVKDGSRLFAQRPSAADLWTKLPSVDWAQSLGTQKSHRELHNFLPLFVGHYRQFLFHSISFSVMLLLWTKTAIGWRERGVVGVIAPAFLTAAEFGFQALTPKIPFCTRVKGVLKVVFIYWLPVLTFLLVLFKVNDAVSQTVYWSALIAHFTISGLVFLLAFQPRRYDLYNSRFQPQVARAPWGALEAFWMVTVILKLALDLMVTQCCAQAVDSIWLSRDKQQGLLVAAQLVVLVVPALLSVFASLSFFVTLMIAFVGACRGFKLLGGSRLFVNRRGIGFTRIPEDVSSRVLQIPQDRPELDFWTSRHWWNRMSDAELGGFINVWGGMLSELRKKDLLNDEEFRSLSFTTVADARKGPPNLPRLLDPNSVWQLKGSLPFNQEAKRRILAFARSAQMRKLPAVTVREVPTLSILIPHYSETIIVEKKDLFNRAGSTDMLKFLVQYYRDEFKNFASRLCQSDELGVGSANLLDCGDRLRSSHIKELEAALCKWTSLRLQTLWRTVEGICHAYAHALLALSKNQEPALSEEDHDEMVCKKFQVVVAVQQYAKFSDKNSPAFNPHMVAAVEAMLQAFGKWLSIAYIDEEDDIAMTNGKRYYTCMINSSCPLKKDDAVGARRPKYRIELPGFPILGNGKSDNQNCAVVFTRGEIIQMIDANQEAYFESSLFLPMALSEFTATRASDGLRPGILGFREHIFSNIGLMGKLAADGEFAFGTVIQRTMDWPMLSRLHYGHPDMLDKLQMLQQGGVSKATRGLNLSEDVFAGIDLTLRGGWSKYREYFHVGKGRDMGFMSVMTFHAKVSMGNGEQATTRQWMRMGLGLPFPRVLGIFYMHVGYYFNQCLISWSMKAFVFMAAYFTLCDEFNMFFADAAESLSASYFGVFYCLFVLASMLPLLFEVLLEDGFRASLKSFGSSLLAFSPLFFSFQSKLISYFFEITISYGGAQYLPTGRGLATVREPFDKLIRCFAAVSMNDGLEAGLWLGVSFGRYYGAVFYFCMGLSIVSWTLSPFIFNPRQFQSCGLLVEDFHIWLKWMFSAQGSDETCWATWSTNLQMVRRNSSMLWIVLPSARLLALICTGVLVQEVVPIHYPFAMTLHWAFSLVPLLPPLSFSCLCLVLAFFQICGVPKCNCYMFMGTLAMACSAAELFLLEKEARHPCVLFHRYMWVRYMLEICDGVVAHRPGGCVLAVWHHACHTFALSWRFLRDLLLGLLLLAPCFALAAMPCISKLHGLFLFRTLPMEEARTRLLDESYSGAPVTAETLLRQYLNDPLSGSGISVSVDGLSPQNSRSWRRQESERGAVRSPNNGPRVPLITATGLPDSIASSTGA